MARINSYPKDINIQDRDAWIGTDSYNRQTKQYTAEAIANYLNVKGKVSIAGQMAYKFYKTAYELQGTFSLQTGLGDGTPFSNITVLAIAKSDIPGKNTVPFIEYLVGQQIMISHQNSFDAFGHYEIASYTQNTSNNKFYDITLSYIGGNGNLYLDQVYDIVNFEFAAIPDKNYVFSQAVASSIWTVQHNLNKFPSCTMVLSTGQQGYGDVKFIDENNLTITFAGATSGKAYIN